MTALDRPPASVDLEVPASALVIVAHPDDAEFQCGATLAKWDDWRVAMSSMSSASLMDTTLAPERPRKMKGRS